MRPSARRSRISGFACVREDAKRDLRPGGRKREARAGGRLEAGRRSLHSAAVTPAKAGIQYPPGRAGMRRQHPQPRRGSLAATSRLGPRDLGLLGPGLRLCRNRDDRLRHGHASSRPTTALATNRPRRAHALGRGDGRGWGNGGGMIPPSVGCRRHLPLKGGEGCMRRDWRPLSDVTPAAGEAGEPGAIGNPGRCFLLHPLRVFPGKALPRPGGRKRKAASGRPNGGGVSEAGLRRDRVRSTPPLSYPRRRVSSIRRGR